MTIANFQSQILKKWGLSKMARNYPCDYGNCPFGEGGGNYTEEDE